MDIVWIVFSITAFILAVAGLVAIRYSKRSGVYAVIGWSLLTMAGGTAVFPALLPTLGVKIWVSAYIVFVLIISGFLTSYTAMRDRTRCEHNV